MSEEAQNEQPDPEDERPKDPLAYWRARCENKESVVMKKALLEHCNRRVSAQEKPKESCHQEMLDYMEVLDHCAMPKAFTMHNSGQQVEDIKSAPKK